MWIALSAARRKRLRPQQEWRGKTRESPEIVTSPSAWSSKLHLRLLRASPPFFFVPFFLSCQIRVVPCFDSVWEALRAKVKNRRQAVYWPLLSQEASCEKLVCTKSKPQNSQVAEHFVISFSQFYPQQISLHFKLHWQTRCFVNIKDILGRHTFLSRLSNCAS